MTPEPERPPRVRRSLYSRFLGFLSRVVGMFERGTGKDRKFSMLRVMLAFSMVAFLQTRVGPWTQYDVQALAIHFMVLPLESLFYSVPLGDLLKGAQANLGGWAMKGAVVVKDRLIKLADESPPVEVPPPTSTKIEVTTGKQPDADGGVTE